ncbi:hypothetical protein [Halorubrum sp. BV1]|uniref:hypothetical protein n=1 Tax=Halorubrum sp. BV1 TaxID=1498500 RepID=UPI00067956D1|nr:hypothetical protein [Halorubrum sp. BV1]
MGQKRRRSRGNSSGLVSRRAALGVLLTGGAAAAGVQGTGAFSAVTGDRQFSVGTADDDTALLGIEPRDPTGTSGDTVSLLTVTNRFSESLTLEQVGVVDAGSLGITRTDLQIDRWTLQSGESTDIEAELACASGATDDIALAIRAVTTDRDESIELTRSTTVACQAPAAQCLTDPEIELEDETVPCIDIDLRGGGEVEIEAEDSVVTGDATITLGGGGEVSVELEGSEIRGDLHVQIRGGGNVSISLEDSDIRGELRIDTPGGAEVEIDMENATIGGGVAATLGGGGTLSLSMDGSTIGDDTVITTGGGASVEVEMDESAIRGDLAVDTKGGSSVEIETKDSEIHGSRPNA